MNGKPDASLMVVNIGLARSTGKLGAEALGAFGLVVSAQTSPMKAQMSLLGTIFYRCI